MGFTNDTATFQRYAIHKCALIDDPESEVFIKNIKNVVNNFNYENCAEQWNECHEDVFVAGQESKEGQQSTYKSYRPHRCLALPYLNRGKEEQKLM